MPTPTASTITRIGGTPADRPSTTAPPAAIRPSLTRPSSCFHFIEIPITAASYDGTVAPLTTLKSRDWHIAAVLIAAPIAPKYESGAVLHSRSAWLALVRSALISSGRV